jgi:uncharacterized damage-inducible protein DinB
MQSALTSFFDRDIQKLKEEILAYPSEASLWETPDGITNSGGNLCLHLCGNLQHFIGAAMGDSGYERDRELEFSRKGVPRAQLLEEIERTRLAVAKVMGHLSGEELEWEFPLLKNGQRVSTSDMLLHLFGHLSYHLGQINYHRRIV